MKVSTLQFLHLLRKNNNREWFNQNKSLYEDAKRDFEHLVDTLIALIQGFDPRIVNLTTKQTTFRIYRDIRFSKDKTPYKQHFGSYIAPGGRKSIYCGYYLHFGIGESMLAGGAYQPQGEYLKKIRSEIYYNLAEFKSIISSDDFKNTFGQLEGDQLKRPPKDFPADFDGIDLLKYKDYTVFHKFEEEKLLNDDFVTYAVDVFKKMKPLNDFMNRALD
jgi:uncharacterized protein (TIGR02453 family)